MLNIFSKLGTWFLFDQDSYGLYFWVNQIFVKVNSGNYNKMKPGSVVKIIRLSFLKAYFCYWRFRKTWCLLKNPEKHWVNNFWFNFCFLFLLCLKLPSWNLHFLVCFCYWPNSFMKGDEGGIFSEAPCRKLLFLLNPNLGEGGGGGGKLPPTPIPPVGFTIITQKQ